MLTWRFVEIPYRTHTHNRIRAVARAELVCVFYEFIFCERETCC